MGNLDRSAGHVTGFFFFPLLFSQNEVSFSVFVLCHMICARYAFSLCFYVTHCFFHVLLVRHVQNEDVELALHVSRFSWVLLPLLRRKDQKFQLKAKSWAYFDCLMASTPAEFDWTCMVWRQMGLAS